MEDFYRKDLRYREIPLAYLGLKQLLQNKFVHLSSGSMSKCSEGEKIENGMENNDIDSGHYVIAIQLSNGNQLQGRLSCSFHLYFQHRCNFKQYK